MTGSKVELELNGSKAPVGEAAVLKEEAIKMVVRPLLQIEIATDKASNRNEYNKDGMQTLNDCRNYIEGIIEGNQLQQTTQIAADRSSTFKEQKNTMFAAGRAEGARADGDKLEQDTTPSQSMK